MDLFVGCSSFEFSLLMQFISLHHLLKLSAIYNRVLHGQVGTCLVDIAVFYSIFFSKLPPLNCCHHIIIVAEFFFYLSVFLLPLCLPACRSQWPCRICMVIEVITASGFYLRLISPRCFIPSWSWWVGNCQESFWRQVTAAESVCAMQFFSHFFILYHFPCILHFFNLHSIRVGWLNTHFLSSTLPHM